MKIAKKILKKTYLASMALSVMFAPACFAAETTEQETDKATSAVCREFAKDKYADLGKVLKAGCEPTLPQMVKLMDNPLGNVAMFFTQFDFSKMTNDAFTDESATKGNYMGIAQFPKKLTEDLNLINRVIWNVPSMPLDQDKIDNAAVAQAQYGESQGATLPPVDSPALPINLFDGRTTGFGDVYYNGLFSPSKGTKIGEGNFVWGAGLDFGFPTASEDILGTGKWLAGPSALGVYMGPKWKVGALLQQYWDYAGPSDRDHVTLTNLQYFIFYALNDVTSIGAAPNIIGNWEQDSGDRWTVPIGLGLVRTVKVGNVPVRLGFEVHYSVIQPDEVASNEWNFRFYIIPAAPSALFDWMN